MPWLHDNLTWKVGNRVDMGQKWGRTRTLYVLFCVHISFSGSGPVIFSRNQMMIPYSAKYLTDNNIYNHIHIFYKMMCHFNGMIKDQQFILFVYLHWSLWPRTRGPAWGLRSRATWDVLTKRLRFVGLSARGSSRLRVVHDWKMYIYIYIYVFTCLPWFYHALPIIFLGRSCNVFPSNPMSPWEAWEWEIPYEWIHGEANLLDPGGPVFVYRFLELGHWICIIKRAGPTSEQKTKNTFLSRLPSSGFLLEEVWHGTRMMMP